MKKVIDPYRIIAIIGLSKNTGKTTTLNYLLDLFKYEKIALTSIGLDGEDIDQINHLPKPKIFIHRGMIVATAKQCLDEANFDYRVIMHTNMQTALGEIVIIESLTKGNVLVAGPTTNQDLKKLIEYMKEKAQRVFIDGAFNRKTFASIEMIDGIVMATGATLSPFLEQTVLKTEQVVDVFLAPQSNEHFDQHTVFAYYVKNHWQSFQDKNYDAIDQRLSHHNSLKMIYVKGAITARLIDILIKQHLEKLTLIVEDATKVLLSKTYYQHLKTMNIKIEVIKKINLLALTINPFSPTGQSYEPKLFKEIMQSHVCIPVYNVLEMEASEIVKT